MIRDQSIICFAGEDWWYHHPHSKNHIMRRLARAGNSIGVEHYGVSLVLNSGLIAAYAPSGTVGGVGSATGIAMFNGGDLVNGAGASILAEGIYATAVVSGH